MIDQQVNRMISIYFAIILFLYVLGLLYFALFVQLKLHPFFSKHSMVDDAQKAGNAYVYLYVTAFYINMGIPAILIPAYSRSWINKAKNSYIGTERFIIAYAGYMIFIGLAMFIFITATAVKSVHWRSTLQDVGEHSLAQNCSGLAFTTITLLITIPCFLIIGIFAYAKQRSRSDPGQSGGAESGNTEFQLEGIDEQQRARKGQFQSWRRMPWPIR